MGLVGQEGKENDGINCYLGNPGGPGLTGGTKMTANVRMVSDLKALLAAQFEDESKKHKADQNNKEVVIDKDDANDLSIKINKALYPSLGIVSSPPSQPSQQKSGKPPGISMELSGEGVDVAGGGVAGGGVAGGGVAGGGGGGSANQATKGHQRTVLRGSREKVPKNKSNNIRSKRISMGKQQP